MKTPQIFLLSLAILTGGLILSSGINRSSGSPGGKSGSPGDGADCSQCHSSTVKTKDGWITTDIPDEGYKPGGVYTITLTASQTGISRFGFELTAEDAAKAKTGTFDTGGNNEIALVNQSKAITHRSSGIAATNGSKSWSFKWTAPVIGTGEVGFYAAVNAANADGGTGGDAIYTTNLKVDEQIDNSIESFLLEGWLKMYPNPAQDVIKVHMNGLSIGKISYRLFNLQGQLLREDHLDVNASNSVLAIPIRDLPIGNYVIYFNGNDLNLKGRFIKLGGR
jgi:hypothetical protein